MSSPHEVEGPAASPSHRQADAPDSCAGESCGLSSDRRHFLGTVAAALAALTLEGLLPARAAALTAENLPRLVTGVATGGAVGVTQEVTYPMPAADGVEIDKKEGVIIARHAGAVYAFALNCPHQNTALRWNAGNSSFQCPRHKSRYQPDGVFVSGRATRAMDRFAVKRSGESLVVNLDVLYEQDKQTAEWGAAKVAV